ncbi:MAG: hypothetical protein OXE83_15330 [Gammaproteobacteria bacterium]|nr:hypothetical protein [Gammaproteobacteria bacterium]
MRARMQGFVIFDYAARDVRENGVPLETYRIKGERTGRQIGAYRCSRNPLRLNQSAIIVRA